MAQTVKCLPTMRETRVLSLGREDLLEKEMATHSRGSSQPRNQTLISFIAGGFFIDEPIWEKPLEIWSEGAIPSWCCWIETGSGFGSEGQELS